MRVFGILLIIVGIVMFATRGFNFQTKEKVLDAGPIEINKTENHWVGWPLYAGGAVAVVGLVLLVSGNRSRRDA